MLILANWSTVGHPRGQSHIPGGSASLAFGSNDAHLCGALAMIVAKWRFVCIVLLLLLLLQSLLCMLGI